MTSTIEHTMTPADLSALFEEQRAAFLEEGPPSAQVRRERLDRLLLAVLGVADDLARALDEDFGHRPRPFSLTVDVASAIASVNHLRDHLEDWMVPAPVPGSEAMGVETTIHSVPLGVVGVIGPWNFPVSLVVQPAAEAIAAGNRVMIKFSDVNTRAGAVLASAIADEFDPREVTVVNGGLDVATAFSDLPFNHLFFTGSPAVGRKVAEAAGRNLVPVTLELGGKNPVVVGRDADLTEAAERIAASRLVNGGQVCLCPDYVFVPDDKLQAFVEETQAAFIRLVPDYPTHPGVTSLVNDRNYQRVVGIIEDAVSKGAKAALGVAEGQAHALPDAATRRIAPTILTGVTEEMTVSREEIFGPVLTVHPYDDVREVVDHVAGRPSPLVAYWYGEDGADFELFRERTTSGGLSRNDFALYLSLPDVPFGGVGQSGSGSYHGKAGFDTFSHRRAVSVSTIPGGAVGQLAPSAQTDEMAGALEAHIAQARQECLSRLGR